MIEVHGPFVIAFDDYHEIVTFKDQLNAVALKPVCAWEIEWETFGITMGNPEYMYLAVYWPNDEEKPEGYGLNNLVHDYYKKVQR